MSIRIAPPEGPWTIADLDRVDDCGFRFELHDGSLVLRPAVTLWQSRIVSRLWAVLNARGLPVERRISVCRSDRSFRTADLAVFPEPLTDLRQSLWDPSAVAIAIELAARPSIEDDLARARWCADAGVARFWRGEPDGIDGAVILQHALATTARGAAAYVQTGVTTLAVLEDQGSNL